jgi:hypothetical protein
MADTETTVKGAVYRVGRLSAMDQLQVARRLTPLLVGMLPAFPALMDARQGGESALMGALAKLMPMADALAGLPDADAAYIVSTCLSVVKQSKDGKNWGALYTRGVCSDDSLTLDVMLPLVVFVVKDALGPFIADFLTSAPAKEVEAA